MKFAGNPSIWSRSAHVRRPAAFRRCATSRTYANSSPPCTPSPAYIETLATSTPISGHVPVDFELHGCPINKAQLIEVISAFLAGRKPAVAAHSVCIECKQRGTVCVMVQGIPCLGPVTHAGCGAICPAFRRGCYGCYGPMESPNTAALAREWRSLGAAPRDLQRAFRSFNAAATAVSDARARPMATKTIRVDLLTRVEGEGALDLQISDGRVTSAQLKIFEPPRLFEALLRGRSYAETPDIVARICGICPIAYQMSAVHAIENAFGVAVDGPLRALRRLIYCGEWIESHALHVVMLHAPDFLGFPDAIQMAREHGEVVRSGLALKKAGNELMRVLGGREIHPVNVKAGGFYRAPSRARTGARSQQSLTHARELAVGLVRWVAGFSFPQFERDYEFVALRHPDEYPFNEGRLVSNRDIDIDIADYETAVRGAAGRAFDRAAFGGEAARRLSGRTARALRAQFRSPAGIGPGSRARIRTRPGLPQSVPEHHRARARNRLRLRGGAAD